MICSVEDDDRHNIVSQRDCQLAWTRSEGALRPAPVGSQPRGCPRLALAAMGFLILSPLRTAMIPLSRGRSMWPPSMRAVDQAAPMPKISATPPAVRPVSPLSSHVHPPAGGLQQRMNPRRHVRPESSPRGQGQPRRSTSSELEPEAAVLTPQASLSTRHQASQLQEIPGGRGGALPAASGEGQQSKKEIT